MTQSDENLTHKVRQLSVSDKKNESAVAKEQSSKIELQQVIEEDSIIFL